MEHIHIVLPLLEALAGCLAVVVVLSFVLTFWYGKETARTRPFVESESRESERYWWDIHQDMYEKHRLYRYVHLGSLFVAILVIESMVRITGVSFEPTLLKVVHYALDATYCILLGMMITRYNGFRSESHGRLAYWLAVSGIGVLTTGLYLYVDFVLKH